jgi:hypothetical protein
MASRYSITTAVDFEFGVNGDNGSRTAPEAPGVYKRWVRSIDYCNPEAVAISSLVRVGFGVSDSGAVRRSEVDLKKIRLGQSRPYSYLYS